LEERAGFGSPYEEFPHVGKVKEPYVGANRFMFGDFAVIP
jgi:hypothetical protein